MGQANKTLQYLRDMGILLSLIRPKPITEALLHRHKFTHPLQELLLTACTAGFVTHISGDESAEKGLKYSLTALGESYLEVRSAMLAHKERWDTRT